MLHYLLFGVLLIVPMAIIGLAIEARGLKRVWLISLVFTVLFWLTAPLYYEFSGLPISVPVTYEAGKVVRHPSGMFTLHGRWFSNLPLNTVASSLTVTPLTENPKVRRVESKLIVRIEDPQAFYLAPGIQDHSRWKLRDNYPGTLELPTVTGVRKEVYLVVQRALYNFHEKHSRELGELYNPLIPEQQERFRKLVKESVTSVLKEEGLEIVSAEFALP